ncbi:MAG: ribonuclease P protein component [bacterium]
MAEGLSEIDAEKEEPASRPNMLPKSKRIPRKLFKQILKNKRHFNSNHFSLVIFPNSSTARFGVSVAKKVSKKAVTRNKIRRRVYSAIRNFITEIKPGLYLVVVKPNTKDVKGVILEKELKSLVVSCRL